MSRRRSASKQSPLDVRYAELGLIRPGECAKSLGLPVDVLVQRALRGAIDVAWFDWDGEQRWGMTAESIDTLRERMWPA